MTEAVDSREDIDLRRFWYIFKRRIWLILSAFILIFTLLMVHSYRIIPVFRATASLIIEQEIPVNSFEIGRGFLENYYETQHEIIRSYVVSEKTLEILGQKSGKNKVNALRGRIRVKPIRNSSLVSVSIDHHDPKAACQEVTALTRAFIIRNMEDRRSASRDTFSWLSEQLAVLKATVARSEMELLKFKEKEDIVSLEKRQILLEERLSLTHTHYTKNQAKTMELKTLLQEIKKIVNQPEMAESMPRIIENALIQTLKAEYSRLEGQLALLHNKYKSKHPKIISLTSQLKSTKKRLGAEVSKIAKSIEIEYKISQTNENSIKKSLDSIKRASMSLAKQAVQYSVLKREAESNKQMYDVMLHRLREADISGSITANNIRVVDHAKVPDFPIRPNRQKDLLVALLVGIAGMVGLCVLFEYIDNTIKNEEDVHFYLSEDVLGVALWVKKHKKALESETLAHCYRDIKTVLNFYRNEHVFKIIVITSAVRAEGKSTSTVMLGKVFADAGLRVLLIDADLYRPSLGKKLEIFVKEGLSDYFLQDKLADDLICKTVVSNLDLMPAGLIPRNPAEMIESEKMGDLIKKQKDQYDLIIIDTPPLAAAFEVATLASQSDGVLFAVKAGSTPRNLVKNNLKRLKTMQTNLLGIILTGAREKYGEGYYKYKYDYQDSR